MDIEKTLTLEAPPARVWTLLLDPTVMGACVPGMQAIEVLSDTEYLAQMQVKIAFVGARFKIRTTIVEQRAPHYLRTEGSGDDASVASSFKQASEMFLDELPDGRTQMRMKVKVDVLGRLGSFGLNVMKTKADRMWDEFGVKLGERLAPQPGAVTVEAPGPAVAAAPAAAAPPAPPQPPVAAQPIVLPPPRAGWFARLFGSRAPAAAGALGAQRQPNDICVEVRRGDATITVLWPVQGGAECGAWLRDLLNPRAAP